MSIILHEDCRYFNGEFPCRFHKKDEKFHCENCPHYDPVKELILIIKLGAAGDVIRTTPLLEKLKNNYPESYIYWLTFTPNLLPDIVDQKMLFKLENILTIRNIHFDILINLDKDKEACALAKEISAHYKYGFVLKNGIPNPVNELAAHKYLTGIFNDISKQNKKSYLEEIFEICGFKFNQEKYNIKNPEQHYTWELNRNKKIIGLNTGCGKRWTSRLWPEDHWIRLANMLKTKGFEVILLGGPNEDEKNNRIQQAAGVKYPGYFSLNTFIDLVNQCDLVVTAVTMTMHITIALRKKIVLFNNIFNKHEFELYNLGKILEPEHCDCYYVPECDQNCMRQITVEKVYNTIEKLLDDN